MLFVSLAFLALLVLEYVVERPAVQWALWIAQWPLWAALTADYIARFLRAPKRAPFLFDFFNVADLFVVLLPLLELLLTQAFGFLRVLRVMRMLRLVRVLALANKVAGDAFKTALRRKNAKYAIGPALFFSLILVVAVYKFEEPYARHGIDSWFEALWWSVTTVTTVGYGDVTPITTPARVAAILLMIVGIAVFSYVTALMASWFVGDEKCEEETPKPPEDRLDSSEEILARLERIEDMLQHSQTADAQTKQRGEQRGHPDT